MKTPKKVSTVTKLTTNTDKLQAHLWREFLVASGTPWNELSDEWAEFFYSQAEIETAQIKLEELAKKAVGEVV